MDQNMHMGSLPNNKPDADAIYNSVVTLQENLRQLAWHDDDIYLVPVDGIFDDKTRDSLVSFQKKYNLPESGVADIETWEKLSEEAEKSRAYHSPTSPIKIFPRYPDDYFWSADSSPIHIQILQYVLNELSHEYEYGEIEYTGIYDDNTRNAVIIFQQKNGLNPTGHVDRTTWNSIARQYNNIADSNR